MSSSISGEQIVGIGFFALVVLGVIFAFVTNRRERRMSSKPLPPLPRNKVFRKPWGVRIFMGMFALLIIIGFPLIYMAQSFDVFGVIGHRSTLTGEEWVLLGLLEIICIAVGLPILYVAGPNDFYINYDLRTYRRVRGWPFRQRVQEGSWEDMSGIYLSYEPRVSQYFVRITWKRNIRDVQHLEAFNRLREAEHFASETAVHLGLPLVETPRQR